MKLKRTPAVIRPRAFSRLHRLPDVEGVPCMTIIVHGYVDP